MKQLCLFALFFAFLFFSCTEDDTKDTIPPTVAINSLNHPLMTDFVCDVSNDNIFTVRSRDNFSFEMIFRDNVALSQYKLDIHSNFDCHEHKENGTIGKVVPTINHVTEDWSFFDFDAIEGTETTVPKTLTVPSDVTAGNYHFVVTAIDQAGNQEEFGKLIHIKALNDKDEIPPQISVEKPSGGVFTVVKGTNIPFRGLISDNYSLVEGRNGVLYLTYTQLATGHTTLSPQIFQFNPPTTNVYNYDFEFTVPTSLTAGDYIFTIHAHDGVNNEADAKNFHIIISD